MRVCLLVCCIVCPSPAVKGSPVSLNPLSAALNCFAQGAQCSQLMQTRVNIFFLVLVCTSLFLILRLMPLLLSLLVLFIPRAVQIVIPRGGRTERVLVTPSPSSPGFAGMSLPVLIPTAPIAPTVV